MVFPVPSKLVSPTWNSILTSSIKAHRNLLQRHHLHIVTGAAPVSREELVIGGHQVLASAPAPTGEPGGYNYLFIPSIAFPG